MTPAFNLPALFAAQWSVTPIMVVGALVVLAGLVCDALIIARFLPERRLQVTPKPWDLVDLVHAVGILAAVFLVSAGTYTVIAVVGKRDLYEMAPLVMSLEFCVRVAVLAGFLVFFQRRRIALRQVFGLNVMPPRAALGWGVAFGLAILPPVGVLVLATEGLCRVLQIKPSDQPLVSLLLQTDSTALMVLVTIFAIVLAPICEEVFFRGFAYPALKQRFGTWRALLFISVAFAITHFHWPSLVPLLVLAFGLGLAYELTGSLLAPIVMHAVFNLVNLLQIFHARAA